MRTCCRARQRVAATLLVVVGGASGGSSAAAAPPTFSATQQQSLGMFPLRSLPMNVDGDRVVDIVTVGADTNSSRIGHVLTLHGNGDGTFRLRQRPNDDITLTGSAERMAAGDTTGDGVADLVVAGIETQTTPVLTYFNRVELLVGVGGGGFLAPTLIQRGPPVSRPGAPLTPIVALGDISGDPSLDLAILDRTTEPAALRLLLGDGRGGFTPTAGSVPIATPLSMTAGDVNGDGRTDLVVTGGTAVSIVFAAPATAAGIAPSSTLSTAPNTAGEASIVDVDQDLVPDLIVTTVSPPPPPGQNSTGDGRLFRGLGRGAFDPTSTFLGFGPLPTIVERQGDLNGDGYPDPLSQGGVLNPLSLLPSADGGPYGPAGTLPGAFVTWANVADLTGDGRDDIALLGFQGVTTLVNTTAFPLPAATTGDATAISRTAMTLTGSVRPRLQPTTAYFEYGSTTAYGSRTPDVPVAALPTAPVTSGLAGLTAARQVHFRLVATNRFGTQIGSDHLATTRSLIGRLRVRSRWRVSTQRGSFTVIGLPVRRGMLISELRRSGSPRVLQRRRVRLRAAQSTVTIAFPNGIAPGRYELTLRAPDESGATIAQIVPVVLRPPREGYARAFVSRVDGGPAVRRVRTGARVIWMNYRFLADPTPRRTTLLQTCRGPVPIRATRRRYRAALTISLSTGSRLPSGTYRCTVRVGSRAIAVATAAVQIR